MGVMDDSKEDMMFSEAKCMQRMYQSVKKFSNNNMLFQYSKNLTQTIPNF